MPLGKTLDTTRIHRVAGRTGRRTAVVTTRPFHAPHHTISDVGLIGGGQVPRPGEVSRAHHGVLCLDARPACRRQVLAELRQPLEESITRIQSPARPRSDRTGCDRRTGPAPDGRARTTIVPQGDPRGQS
jgi:predicted ATPase with chaperone activity